MDEFEQLEKKAYLADDIKEIEMIVPDYLELIDEYAGLCTDSGNVEGFYKLEIILSDFIEQLTTVKNNVVQARKYFKALAVANHIKDEDFNSSLKSNQC